MTASADGSIDEVSARVGPLSKRVRIQLRREGERIHVRAQPRRKAAAGRQHAP